MPTLLPKKLLYGILLLLVLGVVLIIAGAPDAPVAPEATPSATPEPLPSAPLKRVIGESFEGRSIEAYTFGTGTTHLMFVGGIHGGYEWNSVLLAYRFIDHMDGMSDVLPQGIRVSIIPSANPDGLYKVVGKEGRFAISDALLREDAVLKSGRFNARGVDLNRNFDCKWQPTSTWQSKTVSAGTAPFSEPEAAALRDFILREKPAAVIFWHSAASAVYASECKTGILPETLVLMNAYARAAKYQAVKSFDSYPVTGDAEGWLASVGIPAITVELSTHESVEWERNLLGIEALLAHYRP